MGLCTACLNLVCAAIRAPVCEAVRLAAVSSVTSICAGSGCAAGGVLSSFLVKIASAFPILASYCPVA